LPGFAGATRPAKYERELFTWLGGHAQPQLVLTTKARPLSVFTDARYHWISCGDGPSQVDRYFDLLGVDYVLVYPRQRRCRFAARLAERYVRVAEFGRGPQSVQVWALPLGIRHDAPARGKE
jgi:hypothetical protein